MSSFEFAVIKSSPSGDYVEATTRRPALTGDEVYIEITHSGVCGTDQHFRGQDMVLGHEGIGVVKAIGPEVKSLKVGDRAGWGWITEKCGVCDQCIGGHYAYCPSKKEFGSQASDQGSFAHGAVWKEPLIYKLPDNLPSDVAAPLMCAGITVYGPLVEFGVKSSDVVGVVGIGGLGHLAIQFANKMGCEVIALSQTDSKKEEAKRLGAHHFIATKDVKELSSPKKIHHLLVTTSRMPDWAQYASILHPRVQIFPLTVTDFKTDLSFNHMRFLLNGWKIIGNVAAPRYVFREMLEFAALHGIAPVIEKFPLSKQGVIDAMQKLDEGKMRYRGVLYAEKV